MKVQAIAMLLLLALLPIFAKAAAGRPPTFARATAGRQQGPVEQTAQGTRDGAMLVESFDGLGVGFEGPQGKYEGRNPSDNGLAVGPDHIVQTVNSRLAVFTKKGSRYDTTGKVLYGPVNTNTIFTGLNGPCATRNNGDAVVRYDQLADRWLVTMPIFSRIPLTEVGERPPLKQAAPPGQLAAPPGDRPLRQHRHRLLVRRHAAFRRTALRRAQPRRSARTADHARNGARRG